MTDIGVSREDYDKFVIYYTTNIYICMKCSKRTKTAYRIKYSRRHLLKDDKLIWLCEECFNKHIKPQTKEKVEFT